MSVRIESIMARKQEASEFEKRLESVDIITIRFGELKEEWVYKKEDGFEKFVDILQRAKDYACENKCHVDVYARRNDWEPNLRYLIAYLNRRLKYVLII